MFPPHPDLAGAIAQVQGQIESAQSDFRQLVQNTSGADLIETCVVRGAVIAGTASALDAEERCSFVRFRNSLSNIEVIAFDEVLHRLEGLRTLFAYAHVRPKDFTRHRAAFSAHIAAASAPPAPIRAIGG